MLDAVYQLSRRTQDPLEYLTYLKTYSDLCNALTRMIRAQHLITPSVDPHWATLQDVSRELTAGWPGGPAPWSLPDQSGDPAYLAQIQREIDDLRHDTAEYTRLDPEPDPFAILAPDDLPDHPHASYCTGEPSGCMGRATDCTSQASTCKGGVAEYTSHTSTCTGGASEYIPRASDNPIHSVPGSSHEPPCPALPAHPRATSPLSTPKNNLNPSGGLDADHNVDETENGLEAPEDDLTASNSNSQILNPQFEIPDPHYEIPPRPLDPFDYQPKSNFIY
jgi:hypothetical protein